jgi:parallel beta-helix repeat protein
MGNTVSRQDFGIISAFYASPIIDGNTIFDITDNGIILNGFQRPIVSNNTIYNCLNGMLLWYSNAYIENNEIHHCDAGYNVKVESDATIVSDLVRGHEFVGISVNGSRLEVRDTTIQGSTYDGLRIFNNSRVKLVNSLVQNNGDDGFQITGAFTELWDSTVKDNKGDAVYLRDQAHADLRDSIISGNADGPGGNDGDWHLSIESGSRVEVYSSQFDRSAVHFEGTRSKLVVNYFCEMLVMDESRLPVPDAGVEILNETGARKSMGTNMDGEASRYLVLYEQSDLTGDGDGEDPGEKWVHSYDFTIDEDGYIPYVGTLDIDGDLYTEVILERIPSVNIVDHTPADGDTKVPVEAVIWISFDTGIVEVTLDVDMFGQGGIPVSFQTFYHPDNFTVELRPVVDLVEGVLYTVTIKDVAGIDGEIFRDGLSFSFLTMEQQEPDHDEDGIPDRIDPDDDNDGFEDTVEELLGTDPLDSTDFPVTGDDDDTEPVDDDQPDPVDDDDGDDDDEEPDDPVIIPDPPSDDDDEDPDGGIEPYIPVDRPEDMPDGGGDGSTWPLFIIGTVLGIAILAGVILLMFIRGYGGDKLKDSGEEQRRDQG